MKLLLSLFSVISLLSCASVDAATPDHAADVEAITNNIRSGAGAWNAQDLDATAALMADDGDFVNVLGGWTRGKAATMEGQRRILDRVIKKTYLKIEVLDVRFIKPDVAIAHGTVEMFRRNSEGAPDEFMQRNMMTQVLVKDEKGRWLMTAFQNTKIEPAFVPAK
jgi:uncharacterized protein (TIGR02246 family)